jgi:lipoprotein-anchoring transpeptidase ErfK/SrfK
VVVDKSDKVVHVYDASGRMIAQFPATMGSEKDPLPLGNWKVNTIAYNPPFKYQPQLFWDVKDDEPEQMLPPGPNGPVGIVWIDLNKEHIGIHGTNSPETIKRAESHGCVRLTNWDAARLSRMIGNGMEVVFQA